jgi:glycoprotein-N-acetylgalactosamine 3-beta-galactosyltransferase
MWQKVRSIWSYVHDHYRDSFDWYHIGGDNMFVIAENLQLACAQAASQYQGNKPVYMGGAMVRYPYKQKIYCGGGSGYTLNRAALDILVEKKLPTCVPHHVDSDEDRIISHCMLPEAKCHHNVDEMDESRYHPLSPEYHSSWKLRDRAPWQPKILNELHGISATMKEKLDGISKTSVSFHLVPLHTNFTQTSDDGGMRRLHAIVHGKCDQK